MGPLANALRGIAARLPGLTPTSELDELVRRLERAERVILADVALLEHQKHYPRVVGSLALTTTRLIFEPSPRDASGNADRVLVPLEEVAEAHSVKADMTELLTMWPSHPSFAMLRRDGHQAVSTPAAPTGGFARLTHASRQNRLAPPMYDWRTTRHRQIPL